jgi:hypothetical protein
MEKSIAPLKHYNVSIDAATMKKINNQFHEESCTIVHCIFIAKTKYVNGGWVNIYPTTLIEKSGNSFDYLYLQHAMNIPIAPERHYFKKAGDILRFTLYFPAIPKDWKTFSLVEVADGGIGLSTTTIERNDTGVYEVIIR